MDDGRRIAIVGMACRFPGARGHAELWRNLERGVESMTTFSEAELLASGIDPDLIANPAYVPVGAVLDGVDEFDAELFGCTPREAEVKSPQQRLLLETAYEALEDAGCDTSRHPGQVGLYAGTNLNPYEWLNLFPDPDVVGALGEAAVQIANDPDYLTTSISYKLALRGPSINLQTACSTSLVAVHLAVQALRGGECDMALAGGVSIRLPIEPGPRLEAGYLYSPGGIWSSDGHTRSFDARADGTVFGSGVGVVVLKRLADAVAAGDHIYAVILGSAVNNDGADKVGYTAPGVDGQASAISRALSDAAVSAETIGFVEAHGTGTALGDPIEVAGLTQAYRRHTGAVGYCAIGSVKTNIGHLSAAAGVAGLIKAALSLHHGLIPPSLNFETPNPRIGFESSPFFVADRPIPWAAGERVRRAGVSSFGIGGTNAHVILEEPPPPPPAEPGRSWLVLPVSARTPAALEAGVERLAARLGGTDPARFADVAYTLQVGRRAYEHRRAVICHDAEDALNTIASRDPRRFLGGGGPAAANQVSFLFPGQGAQHPRMGLDLARAEPVFRKQLERCRELFREHLGLDLGEVLDGDERRLERTGAAQAALFAVEYSLAMLWLEWGVRPQAMLGHSVGEYVAATLAGVLDLEAAVRLVSTRGRLMQGMPPGSMLAVPMAEAELLPLLGPDLDLAAVNGPRSCVASGPDAAVERLERELADRGLAARRLRTSHAFHSALMDAVLESFGDVVAGIRLQPPRVPFASNVTGAWIEPAQAADPRYWVTHLRHTVRFADGLATMLARPGALLEVGPGETLTTLARQHPAAAGRALVASLGAPRRGGDEQGRVLSALGRLWAGGIDPDWSGFSAGERRSRVPLPTYPFERRRFWVEQPKSGRRRPEPPAAGGRRRVEDWFHIPVWRQRPPLRRPAAMDGRSPWLLLGATTHAGRQVAERLLRLGQDVTAVEAGPGFTRLGERSFHIDPARREDYDALVQALRADGRFPRTVLHLWGLDGAEDPLADFFRPLRLVQALGRAGAAAPVRLVVVAGGLFGVPAGPSMEPLRALCLGPGRVAPREMPNLTCQAIDLDCGREPEAAVDQLVAEAAAEPAAPEVALRGRTRWTPGFEPVRLDGEARVTPRERGVYLVTGGFGGIGATVAGRLARDARARLVLVGRTELPERAGWDRWLAEHGAADRVSRAIHRVRELESAGAEVLPVAADVCDRDQLAAAVQWARSRFGRIDGVVHAAGVAGGGLIELKEPEAAAEVLAPKVLGTRNLWALLGDDGLDFFVLCSSITSVLGTYGQVDYCAANAFLDAFATAVGGPAISIGWDAWAQVGMAVETASGAALAELRDGVRREPVGHPLLQARLVPGSGGSAETVFVAELSARSSWVLDEHRVAGRPVLPGTAYLEMARAALAAAAGGDAPVEISDVLFLLPLSAGDEAAREVRTVLQSSGEFRILSAPAGVQGARLEEHARGRVRRLPAQPGAAHDLSAIRARCDAARPPADGRSGLVASGPRWDALREVLDGDGEALATVELPDGFRDDLRLFSLHPALLDVATAFGLAGSDRMGRFLPLGYGRAVVRRPLPARFHSHLRHAGDPNARDTFTCDVTLIDEDGSELASIEGFLLRRVEESDVRATVAAKQETDRRTLSADAGIMPDEGAEALMRVLGSHPGPHVVVTPRSLEAALERAAAFDQGAVEERLRDAAPAGGGHRTASTPYAPPGNEVESALAELWSQVLGIERVGMDDDFFELGGNSLVAVQMVTRIRDGYRIAFGIQDVLERSTIGRLAELVEERLVARIASLSDEEVAALLEQSGD